MKTERRKYKKELIELGESVHYLKPESAGRDKFNVRWGEGVYAGHREESGEI